MSLVTSYNAYVYVQLHFSCLMWSHASLKGTSFWSTSIVFEDNFTDFYCFQYTKSFFTSDVTKKNLVKVSIHNLFCVKVNDQFVHANFENATIHHKKVTREEVELFDQPSYYGSWQYKDLENTKKLISPCPTKGGWLPSNGLFLVT